MSIREAQLAQIPLLLARRVLPMRRTAVRGGAAVDCAYSLVNRALAAVLIVLLAPLLLFIAWRIWRVDGAPITFAHYRVGQGARLFRCFKFRTMIRDADQVLARLLKTNAQAREEWARDHKLRTDPRVTGIGGFLRTTSLDELPQLFNVLRGEMNFVGPRPVTVAELKRYGKRKRHYLSVKPGLTGLWQVSGRNNTTYDERVEFDAAYVERRNPLYDTWIVARTFKVLVTREGAH